MQKIWALPAVLAFGFVIVTTASGQEIHMKTRTFSPVSGGNPVATTPAPSQGNSGSVHQIVEFNHPVGVNDLDALNIAGAQVTGVLPDNAVVVSTVSGLSSLPNGAVWVGAVDAQDKISPALTANAALANAAGSQTPVIVEFHSDVDATQQAALETSLGVVFIRPAGLLAKHAIVQADANAIALLAAQDQVAYIFPADAALLTGANTYPCAGMLTTAGAIPQYSNITHGWNLDSDNMAHLSYFFGSLTTRVPAASVESEILRAFAQWAKVVNVTFQPTTVANMARSISIEFASGAHGDAYPFDGPGGILAHTFYPAPINSEPIAGDMHFDADEAWQVGSDTDIYTVALHEIGHALGLSHSDNPGDVMYPYYHRGVPLSKNDIGAALELYPAAGSQSSPVTVTAAPVTPPSGTTGTTSAPAPTPTQPAVTPLALTINTAPATTQAAAIELSGTVTGGNGGDSVQWQTDHGYSGNATLSASGAWTTTNIPLVTGPNTLTVMAFNTADQVSTHTATVTLQQASTASTTPITLSISSPVSPVVTVTASAISVSGKASGGAGITEVTWQTSNGATGTACGTGTWVASGIPVPEGNTTIMMHAYDSKGASAWVAVVAVRP